jgi:hypothetical protein
MFLHPHFFSTPSAGLRLVYEHVHEHGRVSVKAIYI